MSAEAALAERIRQRHETAPVGALVPLCPKSQTGKVAPKNNPFIGETGDCALVPAVPVFFEGVEVGREQSRSDQATTDAPTPAPATTPAPAPDWRQADADYLRHHWQCPTCCAAGHGRGQRCAAGARLWNEYEAAWSAAQITSNVRSRT